MNTDKDESLERLITELPNSSFIPPFDVVSDLDTNGNPLLWIKDSVGTKLVVIKGYTGTKELIGLAACKYINERMENNDEESTRS